MRIEPLLLAGLMALPAAAVSGPWDVVFWNPRPMADDVVLPMPCDGFMTFRRVETPVEENWLADLRVQLGRPDVEGQQHAEAPTLETIVGGLTRDGIRHRFYLIGKYEVTKDQWQAVMGPGCPAPADPAEDDSARPATAMSWLDAQAFAAGYTEWLHGHAAQQLTDMAGRDAFLRLPTEVEWEFAARGGAAVTDQVRRQTVFPMDGPIEDYVWFSRACDGSTQPIGILEPNPLGLFDILGNAQEFTFDLFRMRTRGRSHGQVGGAVARGGSCDVAEDRIRSSYRDEVPLTDPQTGKPAGRDSTGLRLLVSAPVLVDATRIADVIEDWQAFGDMRVALEDGDDPMGALARIAAAESDPGIREALEQARATFETEMGRRNEIEGRSARSVVQAGMLTVRDYILTLDEITRAGRVLAQDPQNRVVLDYVSRAEERLQINENLLFGAISHAAEDFDAATFDDALAVVAEENRLRLAAMSQKTRETTARMQDSFAEFVALYREDGSTAPGVFIDRLSALYDSLP